MTHLIGQVAHFDKTKNLLFLNVKRKSGATDTIPIRVPEGITIPNKPYNGEFIYVKGRFCSENDDGHLKLFVLAETVTLCDNYNYNGSSFDGFVCKKPTLRYTPKGREISDLLIAVNSKDNSSYIPCICWGKNSLVSSTLNVGSHVQLTGRIQSRPYIKNGSELIAYEFSVDNLVEIKESPA